MEIEQIVTLIQAVSDSKLTSFTYEENGVKIKLGCELPAGKGACAEHMPMAGQMPVMPMQGMPVPTQMAGMPVSTQMPVNGMQATQMPAASAGTQAADGEAAPAGEIIKSPLVGTFYATPSEGADPYVKVGDVVKKGQVLAIVEAMKLMNEIESDFDGKVEEIYVKSGEPVEYGQPLFRIG